jgi:hypothetical protein
MTAIRPWCARARYPGLKTFLVGTVTLPAEAMGHEIDAALHALAASILPPGFEIIEPMCGALFFQECET